MFFEWMNRPEGSRVAYVVKMAMMALMGAIAVGIILSGFIEETEGPAASFGLAFAVVIAAPVVETLMMWAILSGLGFFLHEFRMKAFVSAGIWAGMHAAGNPISGVIVFWSFLLFSITFLVWQRRSTNDALVMTMAVHALHNVLPAMALMSS